MLKSMTGYGKAVCNFKTKKISIEVRSVNSKQLDISLKIPGFYKEKEMEIRNEIAKVAERGKIDLFVTVEQSEPDKPVQINKSVVKDYFTQIKQIADELNVNINEQLLVSALRLPETLKTESVSLSEEEWDIFLSTLREALSGFAKFRQQEGSALTKDILARVEMIEKMLQEIIPFEKQRIDKVRERISKNLQEFIPQASIDSNRFEQEIIYFLEKIDITEEKVRLKNHCEYFKKTTSSDDSPGRKLGFISQEMGREINTLGSKANDSDIQKRVVMMKDELEKIKEQLLNVL